MVAYGSGSDASPMGPTCPDSSDRTQYLASELNASPRLTLHWRTSVEELDNYLLRCDDAIEVTMLSSFTYLIHGELRGKVWTALI
jgi:hypothetical protein